jgi:hypothetical protein
MTSTSPKDIDYRYFERPYFLVPDDEMAGVKATPSYGMHCARPARSGLPVVAIA